MFTFKVIINASEYEITWNVIMSGVGMPRTHESPWENKMFVKMRNVRQKQYYVKKSLFVDKDDIETKLL